MTRQRSRNELTRVGVGYREQQHGMSEDDGIEVDVWMRGYGCLCSREADDGCTPISRPFAGIQSHHAYDLGGKGTKQVEPG